MYMKKTILFVLTCAMALSLNARNEQVINDLKTDYTRIGCNLHSYEYPVAGTKGYQDTPVPKGYQPFYISHYGRHGSRSAWGDKHYTGLLDVLYKADSLGVLTRTGSELIPIAQAVLASYNQMDGRLTDRGEREHAAIAKRMYERFPEVLSGENVRVQAISSMVQRCIISMCAFTNSLTSLNPKVRYNFDTGEQTQKYIDCTGSDQPVKPAHDSIQKALLKQLPYDKSVVVSRLFTDTTGLNLNVRKLQRDLYETAAISQDFDIDCNVFRYMDTTTVYYYIMETTYYIALYFCNVPEVGAKRLYNSNIALAEWIDKADRAIESGDYQADLRFGHDFPMLTIASNMGIGEIGGDEMHPEEIEQRWIGHHNICMASNIQMIFYKKGGKADRQKGGEADRQKGGEDILVKVLYNEIERPIVGLTPVKDCYYRWEDVKSLWQQKL